LQAEVAHRMPLPGAVHHLRCQGRVLERRGAEAVEGAVVEFHQAIGTGEGVVMAVDTFVVGTRVFDLAVAEVQKDRPSKGNLFGRDQHVEIRSRTGRGLGVVPGGEPGPLSNTGTSAASSRYLRSRWSALLKRRYRVAV